MEQSKESDPGVAGVLYCEDCHIVEIEQEFKVGYKMGRCPQELIYDLFITSWKPRQETFQECCFELSKMRGVGNKILDLVQATAAQVSSLGRGYENGPGKFPSSSRAVHMDYSQTEMVSK